MIAALSLVDVGEISKFIAVATVSERWVIILMDWTIVLSVILGLFLFNVLRASTVLLVGLVRMRMDKNNRVGEIDTLTKRSTLG